MKFPNIWKKRKGSKPPIRCFSTVRTKTRVSLEKKSGTEKKRHERKKNIEAPLRPSACIKLRLYAGQEYMWNCTGPMSCALRWKRADELQSSHVDIAVISVNDQMSLLPNTKRKCPYGRHGPVTSTRIEVSVLLSPLVAPVSMQFRQSQWVPGGSQRLMFVQLLKIN